MSDYYVPQLSAFQAAPSSALKLPNGIGWKRTSDGAYVAYVEGFDTVTASQTHIGNVPLEGAALVAQTETSTDAAEVLLQTSDVPTNRGGASLSLYHEDLSLPTPKFAEARVTTPPKTRRIIDQGGTSDFVQASPSVVTHTQIMSRPAECYLSTGVGLVAGWQQIPMQSINWDPDGLLASNGVGYYLTVQDGGYYTVNVTAEITNNTGGNVDVAVGFNNAYIVARTTIGNTWSYAGSGTRTFQCVPGTVVYPAIYVSTVAGFGIPFQANACWFGVQRVA